jgi:membrane-associated phospholipid phosphatase
VLKRQTPYQVEGNKKVTPYEIDEPAPLWKTFLLCWAGTLAMFPSFLLWSLKLGMRRLSVFDWQLTRELRNHSKLWVVFSRLGDGWLYAATVLYLVRSHLQEEAGHIAACIVLAWGGAAFLKLLVRRRRPLDQMLQRIDSGFRPSLWSFPSQHAACAVAFAAAALSYNEPWSSIAVTQLAFWISVSRVAIGSHFVSDVLAGVLLGLAAGYWG